MNKVLSVLALMALFTASAYAQNVPLETDLGRVNVCVTGDTLVTTSDNQKIKIKDVQVGMSILNGNMKPVKILYRVKGPEKKTVYEIEFANGSKITATSDHAFVDNNGMFIISTELAPGQVVRSINGTTNVTKVTKLETYPEVWNLILADESLFNNFDRTKTLKVVGGTLGWRELLRKENPFLGLDESSHTFFINDILGGDVVIQMSLKQ